MFLADPEQFADQIDLDRPKFFLCRRDPIVAFDFFLKERRIEFV